MDEIGRSINRVWLGKFVGRGSAPLPRRRSRFGRLTAPQAVTIALVSVLVIGVVGAAIGGVGSSDMRQANAPAQIRAQDGIADGGASSDATQVQPAMAPAQYRL